jgi:hypothetical protein
MKIKDRCGKLGNEAGMLLITSEIQAESRNVTETKGLTNYPKDLT